jgi:ABC-type polysaccharide/polyol phosphate transport system ATPase subunit
MQLVQELCQRALWLDGGRARALGPSAAVTAEYQGASQ